MALLRWRKRRRRCLRQTPLLLAVAVRTLVVLILRGMGRMCRGDAAGGRPPVTRGTTIWVTVMTMTMTALSVTVTCATAMTVTVAATGTVTRTGGLPTGVEKRADQSSVDSGETDGARSTAWMAPTPAPPPLPVQCAHATHPLQERARPCLMEGGPARRSLRGTHRRSRMSRASVGVAAADGMRRREAVGAKAEAVVTAAVAPVKTAAGLGVVVGWGRTRGRRAE